MVPTQGEVKTNGRISALLELGAGFNPEFTGKDNVYLNGAIMGLSRETMDERFEDIVSFADIGEFINQPVKTYSSGMYVRLAFACAINVNPDILVIDEALSVGDVKFQHKCFNKFIEFQEKGKTILFVSHSTDAIVKHCDSAILLDNGMIVEIGESKSIANYYVDLLFTGQITGYAHSPVLLEEDYNGFHLVHYKKEYFAVSRSSEFIDFNIPYEEKFKEYMAKNKFIVGPSLENVKKLVDQVVTPVADSLNQNIESFTVKREKTELDKFLQDNPITDNCTYRKSYNKNEHRYGNRHAEIIDYLIVAGDKYDPVKICSGDIADIYLKVIYHKFVKCPMFGFSIKTVDGIVVFASSTWLNKITIQSANKSDIVLFRFSIRMSLHSGDYFIDLGSGEICGKKSLPLDRRYGIIHLAIRGHNRFDGFAELETTFQKILIKQG